MQIEGGFVIECHYSAWQKKKVRTVLVNARAKSQQQRSINAALKVAQPYDRIELSGGEYAEAVTINFPLELVASEGEEPHIISRNSGITFTANVDVLVENLTIVSRSSAGKLDAAITVMAGTPTIRQCTLSSVIVGGSSRPLLEDCRISSSSSGYGLVVQDAGGGTVKDCTIRGHKTACVAVDTRGELLLAECTLANKGADVVVISASNSSVPLPSFGGAEAGVQLLRSSGVTLRHCRVYVDPIPFDVDSNGASGGLVANTAGCPCCITISNGAAPTCEANDLLEGEVGIMLDGSGAAQLRGNNVRCQRRCGILALVEEGFAYLEGYQSLRISGGNVLERCFIGIDVQCRGNQKDIFAVPADGRLSNALPAPKRAFQWLPEGTAGTGPQASAAASSTSAATPRQWAEDPAHTRFLLERELTNPVAVRAALAKLLARVLQAHPTCLQPSFVIATGHMSLPSMTAGLTTGASSNPVAEVLTGLMETKLPPAVLTAGAASGRDEEERAAVLELRGNRGVDIVQTKFSNCNLCAVRFGKQSYGLVEDCTIEDCGMHAIIVEAAAHPLITGCRFLRSRGASIVLTSFAHPLILGNEIAAGQVHGIEVTNMSRGIIAGNLISGNRGSGVRVAQKSSTVLCGNVISQNRGAGVCVTDAGQPLLLANSLSANAVANVLCTDASNAFLAFNAVTSSPDAGLLFSNCSRATVVCNDVSQNGDGIVVELDADPVVRGNTIQENLHSGILARNNALGCFTKNRILKNSGPNVLVVEGANPLLRENAITGSANGGVFVTQEGTGIFEKNDIGENAVANAMVVHSHSEPEFRGNSIHSSSSGCGIVCARGAGGLFRHNTVHDNKQAGVYILLAANPLLEQNRIRREAVGIVVSDAGRGRIVENSIEDCFGSGAISQREAEPLFERNTVSRNGMSGLLIAPDGLGRFVENTFTGNGIGVQLGSSLPGSSLALPSAYLNGPADGDPFAPAGAAPRQRASSSASTSHGSDSALSRTSGGGGGSTTVPPGVARRTSTTTFLLAAGLPTASGDGAPPTATPGGEGRRRSSVFFSPTGMRSALQEAASVAGRRRASMARSTACQLCRNTIRANKNGGVLLELCCNGIMEDNTITGNGRYGVWANTDYTTRRAQAIVEERFAITGVSPVVSAPAAAAANPMLEVTLTKNRIHEHQVANVAFESFTDKSGTVKLVQNDIHTAPMGFLVTNASTVSLADGNEVHHCLDGMYFDGGGSGDFTQNRIHDCHLCGVYVSTEGAPRFVSGNVTESCGLCGVMVDVGGRGSFLKGAMRHCGLAGVIAFAGATTPFHVSYDEARQAGIFSAAPTFEENTIEENDTHGVLVLSVISGAALRTQRADVAAFLQDEKPHFPVVVPAPKAGGGRSSGVASGERMCAYFARNLIQKNRLFGVFHDRFDHWDLEMLADVLPPPSHRTPVASPRGVPLGNSTSLSMGSSSYAAPKRLLQQRPLTSSPPERAIKNAYGGYEVLLGTSQIGASGEHHRQRELKQVTFKENTISHSCVGFAAGYGCHPFLLRNKIVHNIFIGLFLRFGSAVMASQCDVSRNGLAGIQAASGAKGFISKGTIKANNSLCRPAGRPHEPRSFEQVMGDVALPHHGATEVLHLRALEEISPKEVRGVHLASEQLTELAVVHRSTLAEAVRMLWELAGASSAGIAIASGCLPSSLSTGSEAGADPAASMSGADNGLGGLGVLDYIRLCVADGGLGVWIEEGSRVTLSENVIEGNAHAGVYFAAGLVKQHRTLHRFFSMAGDGGAGALDGAASPDGGPRTLGIGAVKATKNGILTGGKAAEAKTGQGREAASAMDAMFAAALQHPVLATQQAAALFTSHGLCATGVMAAATAMHRRVSLLSSSDFAMESSFNATSGAGSFALDAAAGGGQPVTPRMDSANPNAKANGGEDEDSNGQRMDSIHCALVAENVITENGEYGVFLEVSQAMTTSDANGSSGASQPTEPAAGQLAVTSADTAVLTGGEMLANHLDFHIIVEGNTITGNKRCGVFCQHVVDIHAAQHIANRGTLRDWIHQSYEAVRTELVLSRGGGSATALRTVASAAATTLKPLPFSTRGVPQKTHRAFLLGNELARNGGVQAEVTSRYVVRSGDGTRTLLQLDTAAELPTSSFSSHVLVNIPVTAALLGRPPTGLFLWEKNSIHSGKHGIRVQGYVGAASLRLQRNQFGKIAEDAVLVEGHLSSCTVGTGNVFRNCGVGVRVTSDATMCGERIASSGVAAPSRERPGDLRTRIFGNTFSASTQAAVTVDRCVGEHVLLHSNEFMHHGYGTVALFLTNRAVGGVLVQANTFRDSFSPVVISAMGGALGGGETSPQAAPFSAAVRMKDANRRDTLAAASASVSHTLRDNQFVGNFIGLVVCNGATPTVVHNIFDSNQHAGIEVLGISTRPVVEGCVFRKHRRPLDTSSPAASPTPSLTAFSPLTSSTSIATAASSLRAAVAMKYPESGTITLFSGTFSVDLVGGNRRVLSPNSQVCLPAGLLLGPFAECVVSSSLFAANDVGVDAARVVVPHSLALSTSVATVKDCVFYDSRVAGVLVRSPGEGCDEGGPDAVRLQTSSAASRGSAVSPSGASRMSSAAATEDTRPPPETTVVCGCFFMANSATLELCGDVVALQDGFAAFRANVFFGSVHCKDGSLALLAGNTYLIDRSAADAASEEDDVFPLDGEGSTSRKTLPATRKPALPAIIFHEGAKSIVEENVVAFRLRGLLVCPDAGGQARRNCFMGCTTAVTVAPFSHTTVAENRMLRSRDCAVLAYGGLVTANEVFDAPTGIVLQPPAQYKAYNAIPSHKRSTTDLPLCTRNTVTACGGDGVLVACSAKVESNVVCKCQNGINIVCPATMEMTAAAAGIAGLTGPPQVLHNTVYDCGNGVYMDNGSASVVSGNEVFDNDFTGVLVVGSATGALQNNTISSASEHGAVEMPPDCRVKTVGNVIRNQFSPAYNRTTRANRAREHVTKKEGVEREIGTMESDVDAALDKGTQQLVNLTALPDDIVNRFTAAAAKTMSGGGGAAAGLVSRALLRRSLERAIHGDNNGDAAGAARDSGREAAVSPDTAATTAPFASSATTPMKHNRLSSVTVEAVDARPAKRQTSAGTRRTSRAAAEARKSAAETTAVRSGAWASGSTAGATLSSSGANSPTLAQRALPKPVVIHVFARPDVANAHTAGLALGEAVARVLASPPMSRMHLTTTITTSTSHLTTTLRALPAPPFVIIAVMDGHTSTDEAFFLLHEASRRSDEAAGPSHKKLKRAASAAASAASATKPLVYLILPASVQPAARSHERSVTASPQDLGSRGGSASLFEKDSTSGTGGAASDRRRLSLKAFAAAATGVFPFRSGVEDALEPLKEAMAADIAQTSAGATARRQSVAVVFSPRETALCGDDRSRPAFPNSDDGNEEEDSDRSTTSQPRREGGDGKGKPPRTHSATAAHNPSPTLSRERIGELLSMLTPEALGYAAPSSGAKKKRRNSSVVSSAGGSNPGRASNAGTLSPSAARKGSVSTGAGAKTGRPPSGKRRSLASAAKPTGTKKSKRSGSVAGAASAKPDGGTPRSRKGSQSAAPPKPSD